MPRQAAPIACFLLALVVYLLTLAPSVVGGDSGELILVAAHLEVAHPPGYPLYTLLAYVFTLGPWSLPFGPNLLSALAEAAAVAVLCRVVIRVTGRPAVAMAAALCFAFSPVVWTHATSAEVFALHHLFVALLLDAALALAFDPAPKRLFALGLITGLGLSHHHTLAFTALPVGAFALLVTRTLPGRGRAWVLGALGVVLGLLPYLYLPLAAESATTLSMGNPALGSFLHHVLRRDYGTLRLVGEGGVATSSTLWGRLGLYAQSFASTTLLVGIPLALVGAVRLASGKAATSSLSPRAQRLVLLAWPLYVVPFLALAAIDISSPLLRGVLARFFGQGHLLGVVVAAAGLAAIASRVAHRGPRLHWALTAVLVCAGVVPLALHVTEMRSLQNTHVEEYGRALLADLPPGAVLLTRGDLPTNAARFAQAGLGVRPDVVLLDQELLTYPWYVTRAQRLPAPLHFPAARYHPGKDDGFSLAELLAANSARTFYVFPGVKDGDTSLDVHFAKEPAGLPVRLVPRASLLDVGTPARWLSAAPLNTLRPLAWPADPDLPAGAWERVVADDVAEAFHRWGLFLLEQGISRGGDRPLLERARDVLQETQTRLGAATPWYVWKNLGVAHAQLSLSDPDEKPRARAAFEAYLRAAPLDEPDRRRVTEALKGL